MDMPGFHEYRRHRDHRFSDGQSGLFSFGTANDYTSTAARHCQTLIVEVNENMPRVFGDSLLHISEVDTIVENHVPLVGMESPEPKSEDEAIGEIRI
jgi:itaconate CoA-transferase